MARVLGIGGVFVKSRDPDALRAWYRDVLGFELQPWGGAELESTGKSSSVWTPFKETTEYFLPSDKAFMINFRVDDLDGMLARAREHGANVLDRREDADYGKFGYVLDPEGTLLELYQPMA